ncbi:PDDEXK nuclease domain-containing protein [Arthrobacter sp. 260]|uniref:PDDEXK nuclease domain-containing protein n=1 Tax=Arthrobacter sp. 260 TaxID=2735314 RepID=UPI0014927822|nr:DUF1016 family protein [Arthrobacter sp. 260]
MSEPDSVVPAGYSLFLEDLKARVSSARVQAQRSVNTALIGLYWTIGDRILAEQKRQGWGSAVIGRLATDLRREFPDMTGLSRSNLQYMRSFAGAWPGWEVNVPHPVGHLPWGHIRVLIDKNLSPEGRDEYAAAAVKHGWSRNVLMNMIMNKTLERSGAAPSNFSQHLPTQDSELAQQMAKDPYALEFLGLTGDVAERELEQALMDRIVETLRELGPGFAFVGRQVHFDVSGDDFYLDLLFFHVDQLRYVVIELKTGRFQPEYAGKLQFYIALVDDKLRRPAHAPTVGILICGSRNDHTVRYALNQSGSPMAISTYTYETLPPAEQQSLPDAEDLAAALSLLPAESTEGTTDTEASSNTQNTAHFSHSRAGTAPQVQQWPQAPRAHRNRAEVERKLSLLDEAHVKPLNDWVRDLNRARATSASESVVPWFDPSGGGINARVLFLLEAPGSRSSASRGSGIISIDNNDGTAANWFTLIQQAALPREAFASWNIVPWYLPDGSRTRTTRMADVVEATSDLETVLDLFPHLQLVIPMGTLARAGWELLRSRSPKIATIPWETVPHPSATNLNTRPAQRDQILQVMTAAAQKFTPVP